MSTEGRVGVYLDTNVIIDLGQALDGSWQPPEEMTTLDRRLVAVARLFLYARRPARAWWLVASREAIHEHLRDLGKELLEAHLSEVDANSDAPPADVVAEVAARYRAVGVGEMDARHTAQAALRPWIRYVVTSDDKFRTGAPRVDLDHSPDFLDPEQAVALLEIEPGEYPAIAPAPSNPLSESTPWWIPQEGR